MDFNAYLHINNSNMTDLWFVRVSLFYGVRSRNVSDLNCVVPLKMCVLFNILHFYGFVAFLAMCVFKYGREW